MENTTHVQKVEKIKLNSDRNTKNRKKLDEFIKRVNDNKHNNAKSTGRKLSGDC